MGAAVVGPGQPNHSTSARQRPTILDVDHVTAANVASRTIVAKNLATVP